MFVNHLKQGGLGGDVNSEKGGGVVQLLGRVNSPWKRNAVGCYVRTGRLGGARSKSRWARGVACVYDNIADARPLHPGRASVSISSTATASSRDVTTNTADNTTQHDTCTRTNHQPLFTPLDLATSD